MSGLTSIFSTLGTFISLGVAVYLLVLANRLVTAVERIADKLSTPPSS